MFKRLIPIIALLALSILPAAAGIIEIKQSSTQTPLLFEMIDTSGNPVTGLSPTVTLSKAGAAFGAPSGAVTEIASGWYKVAANATDTGTLGILILHATGTGAIPDNETYDVVPYDITDGVRLGLTALPNAAAGASGGLPTGDSSGHVTLNTTEDGNLTDLHQLVQTKSTVNDGLSTTTAVDTALTSTTANLYKGNFIVFTSGANAGVTDVISAYSGTTKQLTMLTALPSAPANTDAFIIASGVPSKTVDALSALGSDNRPKVSADAHTGGVTVAGVTATVTANATQLGGQNVVLDGNNFPKVDTEDWHATAITTAVPNTASTTVTTNNDKTGYSLTQAFPTNFSSLGITGGGAVTVGTNNDKTGYTASTVSDKTGYSLSATQSYNNTGQTTAVTLGTTDEANLVKLAAALTPFTGTVTDGSSTTTAIDTGLGSTDLYTGGLIVFTSGADAGVSRHISAYNTSTHVATVLSALPSAPANTDAFTIVSAGKSLTTFLAALGSDNRPKISADVHTAGATVAAVTGAVGSVTAGVTVTTNNDKTGYSLTQAFPANFSSLAITGGGAVTAGTVSDKTGYSLSTSQTFSTTGSVGSVTGAVGSVTAAVTAGTVSDKTGYALTSGEHTNIAGDVLSATASSYNTGGTIGAKINSAATASDPWSTALPGSYTSGQAGYIVGHNIDAQVSGRMASGNVTVGGYASGQDPATLVLGATASIWNTASTIWAKVNTAAALDPWATLIPGAYASGSAGYKLGNLLTTAPSWYTAPTNADTSGLTTLLSRIPMAILYDGSGYVKANSYVLPASAPSWYTAPPTAAQNATAVFAYTVDPLGSTPLSALDMWLELYQNNVATAVVTYPTSTTQLNVYKRNDGTTTGYSSTVSKNGSGQITGRTNSVGTEP